MANQNACDSAQGDRRRSKATGQQLFANAMGDGNRNPDSRKLQSNKKVQAEEENYSTGDESYDYRAGDRGIHRSAQQKYSTQCEYLLYDEVPYVGGCPQHSWKHPLVSRPEVMHKPTQQQPKSNKTKLDFLKDKFKQVNNMPDDKAMEASTRDKNEFIQECYEEAAKMKGHSILKHHIHHPGHVSNHSDGTYINAQDEIYSHSDQFTDQESSEEKQKKPIINILRSKAAYTKPSARSNCTSRSKKAEELVNLQRLKSDIIEVIQDGIQKIGKTTSENPSRESQNIQNSATSITNQNSSDILQSDVLTSFVKQLRDNHLGNILHEVKNLHFLESLPERCQNKKDREY